MEPGSFLFYSPAFLWTAPAVAFLQTLIRSRALPEGIRRPETIFPRATLSPAEGHFGLSL